MWNELRAARDVKVLYATKQDFWDFYKMNIQSIASMYATEKGRLNRLEIVTAQREIDQIECLPLNLLSDYMKVRLEELNGILKKT